jgi:hypothetical protein
MFHAGEEASSPLQAIAEGGDIQSMNDLLELAPVPVLQPVMACWYQVPAYAGALPIPYSTLCYRSVGMLLPTNDGRRCLILLCYLCGG